MSPQIIREHAAVVIGRFLAGFDDDQDAARLLTIFRKVADALAFAHSKGIIHRDLKPEKVMAGEFGEALLMDWGLAKIQDGETSSLSDLGRETP